MKRTREEVEQAALESYNISRRLDGLPPVKKIAHEWNRVSDPDADMFYAEEEAYLLFDDDDDEEIYMLTKGRKAPPSLRRV